MPNLDYVSVDLYSRLAMINMDATDIKFPEGTFDCVLCYHVLEHIPDDKKAMSEILRVLKPGGWGILQVPILAETTIEDPAINSPEDRERVYGQSDHVRAYGLDYKDRLEDAGFIVTVDDYVSELGGEVVRRCGLEKDECIYYCVKPSL
jgi:SAM-dependent methyltransferase